ncbi:family 1 glycosylhydrolase [Streptacidiphilus fuscans]|uniref:Family 1 glycosylhydrolase n=1 Tax=Streptacidiphilus fuscans TaxID=2789292 RepID=A0A931FGM1_9ACTN|nr:family 1 glycosylhydrolase [Streptacidiphilus fuscans]MBF9072768.1 family 1 glycosylhydrolase [Streptacidiphilus fuscans]
MFSSAPGVPLPHDFLFGATGPVRATDGGCRTAADGHHRWREDAGLLAELGFGGCRLGVDWARVETAPGRFSLSALDGYRRLVDAALDQGLRPLVVLQRHSIPTWFAERGGWSAPDAADLFARYAALATRAVGIGVRHVCTISGPDIAAALDARARPGPAAAQGRKDRLRPTDPRVADGLVRAHRRAVQAIKASGSHVQVGWSVAGEPQSSGPGPDCIADSGRDTRADVFLEAAHGDDWIGVQTPTRRPTGHARHAGTLGRALRRIADVVGDLPLFVTAHGIATDDDTLRVAYTAAGLDDVAKALAGGLDVRGYLHHSALDAHPRTPCHPASGLIAVDRWSHRRVPKPSAAWLGGIARSRRLPSSHHVHEPAVPTPRKPVD